LIKRIHIGLLLLSLFVGATFSVFAQPWSDGGFEGTRGEPVTPRSVNVRNLPRVTVPHPGPPQIIRRGDPPEGKAAFEEWKKSQPAVILKQNVTIDPSAATHVSVQAPAVGVGFEGTTQQGYIPGEPQVAVGADHVLVIGNVSIAIANKDGTGRTEVLQTDFFGIPASEGPGFDGKCFYDHLRGRFVVLSETQGVSGNTKWSYYYLAISKTSDARGEWFIYKFDMRKDGTTQTNNWSDFPGLGVSDDKLVMSGQQYTFTKNQYKYQKLRVISRDSAYAGQNVSYVDFVNFPAPPGGGTSSLFVTKPGRNVSPDSTIHLFTTRYNGGSTVAYRTLTGPPSAPILSTGALIAVNPYSLPVDAKQLGSPNLLDAGDCRTPDFFVRNGILNIAWHFGVNLGSGTVDAIRYLQLRTSDLTVLTDETFGADGIYYYYPMVCVDSVGTMFMGFCRSSTSEYSSMWVTGKRRSDAAIQPSALAKSGVAGNNQSRWGDFTGIDMDETASSSTGSSAWYSGLWAKGTNTFGTWVSQLTFSYGTISGQVLLDADGDTTTSNDRSPLSAWTVILKQGVSTIATTATDPSGNYSFGYLESGTYQVALTLQSGYYAVGANPGTGGTSQSKSDSLTIQVTLTNSQSSTSNNFLESQRVIASVKVFLEGPFSSGSMRTDINALLPLSSPYGWAPRTVGSIPGANVVDWINIELRTTADGSAVASKSFFLKNDGMVVDSGESDTGLEFNVPPGNYYIVVKHRNHLSIMSAGTVALGSSSSLYDFTTGSGQYYGGTDAAKDLGSGVWGMVGGNAENSDQDCSPSDLAVIKVGFLAGLSGYENGDANMDGDVAPSDYALSKLNFLAGRSSQVP